MSYNDLKTQISLRTSEKLASVGQEYETLAIVVSQALGGGKNTGPKADPSTAPTTAGELEALLKKRLG